VSAGELWVKRRPGFEDRGGDRGLDLRKWQPKFESGTVASVPFPENDMVSVQAVPISPFPISSHFPANHRNIHLLQAAFYAVKLEVQRREC